MNLTELVRETTPNLNPDTCGGYVRYRSQHFETYLNSIFRVMVSRLPDSITCQPLVRVDPEEEFKYMSQRYERKSYDFSRTDTYMMKTTFHYNGEKLSDAYIRLPYFNQGDIIYLYGAAYSACPVLTDKSISLKGNTVFVPLTCDRFIFTRESFSYVRNGVRDVGYLLYSPIHHLAKTLSNSKVSQKTTIIHYLLAKFGLTETLTKLRMSGTVFGIDEEGYSEYRAKGYAMYSYDARRTLPRNVSKHMASYAAEPPIWFAIPESVPRSIADGFAASFYYLYMYNMHRVSLLEVDDTTLFQIILGRTIFPNGETDVMVLNKVTDHLKVVDNFMDDFSRFRFAQDNIHVETFYDVLVFLACDLYTYLEGYNQNSTSMYNKMLMVEFYYFEDVIKGIFRTMYEIQNCFARREPPLKELINFFNRKFPTDRILALNQSAHPEVESVSSSTPCMAYKLTTRLAKRTGKAAKSAGGAQFDPVVSALDASIAEVSNYLCITKAEPTGRGQLNPFVRINAEGGIIRNNEFRELIDHTQKRLERT